MEAIRNECHQLRFTQRLFHRMTVKVNEWGKRMRKRYESKNVFGRWLQTMQLYSREQLDLQHPLFPEQPNGGEESRAELLRMLRQDIRMEEEEAAVHLTNELFDMIGQFREEGEKERRDWDIDLQYEENERGARIVIPDVLQTPWSPTVRRLVNEYGRERTALVCLRYHKLGLFRGGESSLSFSAMETLYETGQAEFEGFASPLNCLLLGRPGVRFCSLFEDTDAVFGSLGNFFRIRLADHPGGWILHPPFVEPVLNATAARVVATLEEAESTSGDFWFYIIFPVWDDCEGWQTLSQSPWKRAEIRLGPSPRQDFRQTEQYGTEYLAKVKLCIFVLGQLPDGVDLMDLRHRIQGNHF